MSRTSRREFAKTLTVAGAALPLLAQTTPEPKPPANALGIAMSEVVRAQYGQHLDGEDMIRVGTTLQEHAAMLERFRQFKLANSDEPDFTFSALADRW